jgi:hypothetical protein
LIVLAGCDGETAGGGPQSPDAARVDIDAALTPHVPTACAYQIALCGMTGSAEPTPVGPVTVDAAGIDICMTLDARDNIQLAHFAADTAYEPGNSSSFHLSLYAKDGTPLRDGWDVTFGSSPATTFASVEYGIDKGQLVEAVLWVRAKAGSATSQVQLHLFEPLE